MAPDGSTDERPATSRVAVTALRGTGWRLTAQLGGKGATLVATVLLARLLEPEDFGVAAYALTLMALFAAVPTLGIGPALIYHAEDDDWASTAFWLGLAGGLGCFALIWCAAPLAEHLFGDPRAVGVTRGLAWIFPIEALSNVHSTLLRKRLAFRRTVAPQLVRALIKGVASIGLALAGFGAWALIGGSLAGAAAGVPVFWWALAWRPRAVFDRGAAAALLPFGGRVVGVNSLGALVRNLDYLIVGRVLGAVSLGVYTLAFRLPDLLIREFVSVVGQVLLPVYARLREEREAVADAFVTTLSYVVALTAPLTIGLALLAEPLVITAFSEKWRDVVVVIPPICAYALFVSISFNVGDLYKALGRPDVLLRLALLRAALALPALLGAAHLFGTPAAVGWGQAGVAAVMAAVELEVARTRFGLPVAAALARLAPVAGACAVCAAALWTLGAAMPDAPPALVLIAGTVIGGASYALCLASLAPDFVRVGWMALRDALDGRKPAWEPARS